MISGALPTMESNADHGLALATNSPCDTIPVHAPRSEALSSCEATHLAESGVVARTVYRGVRKTSGAPSQPGHFAAWASELSG
jgi:hypothetical protein